MLDTDEENDPKLDEKLDGLNADEPEYQAAVAVCMSMSWNAAPSGRRT